MNPALKDMLDAYQPQTPADYQNAAREIVQEIALLGLWRGGFFERAAFYGGTALRIFHGLRRFSEDLDFTLLSAEDDSRLETYLPSVATELESWGFSFEAEKKSEGERTGIESAFLKGGTQLNLLHIGEHADLASSLEKKLAAWNAEMKPPGIPRNPLNEQERKMYRYHFGDPDSRISPDVPQLPDGAAGHLPETRPDGRIESSRQSLEER
jgi:hypothetical protein